MSTTPGWDPDPMPIDYDDPADVRDAYTPIRQLPPMELSVAGPVIDPAVLRLPPPFGAEAEAASSRGDGLVAAGLILRFGEPASLDVVRSRVDALATVDRWWAGLTESQRYGGPIWVLGAAIALCDQALDLRDAPLPEDDGWRLAVVALLEARDALASAEVALLHLGRGDALPREWIGGADAVIQQVLDGAYCDLGPLGPLLDTVAERDAGWWARPSRWRGGGR